MLIAVGAAAAWIGSLGPAPLGERLEFSTAVVDRDGRLLRPYATTQGRWRLPARADGVDPRYLALLIAYEDKRFREHAGVDVFALMRAAAQIFAHGRIVSGGSTLTMQVARLLEPRAERSLAAKLRQMVRAVEIERHLTKDEVLTLYLSMAPYGGNLEGIRAGALAYFGKEPRRLTLGEAALLVALPQSPEARRPDRSIETARRARDRVLDRVAALGIFDPAEIAQAKAEPVPAVRTPMPSLAPHAADEAVAALPGRSLIRLTIDGPWQASLEELARERARALGPNISVAILAVDHATGEVLARVGSAGYFDDQRAGQVDMTNALRSPGSTLKPFIYGLGFEDGLDPSGDADRRSPGALRRLCAGEFRSDLPGHGGGPQGAADVAERAGGRGAGQGRRGPLHGAAAPGRRQRWCFPRAKFPGSPWAWAASGCGFPIWCGFMQGWRGSAPRCRSPSAAEAALPAAATRAADASAGRRTADGAGRGLVCRQHPDRHAAAGECSRPGASHSRPARATAIAMPGRSASTASAPSASGSAGPTAPRFPASSGGPRRRRSCSMPSPVRERRRRRCPMRRAGRCSPPTPSCRCRCSDSVRSAFPAKASEPALKIMFPPNGARLELTAGDGGGADPLALKISGGALPLTVLVNGVPLGAATAKRTVFFQPDGPGFVRLTVMDARGAADSVVVRLQ